MNAEREIVYYDTPQAFDEGDLCGKIAVIIDVLRASSTITYALSQGVTRVYPFESLEELFKKRDTMEKGTFITGGERDGKPLEELDLGNSPTEYKRETCEGKALLLCTTNGTKALVRASKATRVFAASFLNAEAAVQRLLRETGSIAIVGSGWKGEPSLEDTLCAGKILSLLEEQGAGFSPSDSAKNALEEYRFHKENLSEAIHSSDAAQRLANLGYYPDVDFCLQQGILSLVPELEKESFSLVATVVAGRVPETAEGKRPAKKKKREFNEKRMSFGDHLEELRRRIILCIIAIAGCFFFCYFIHTPLTGIVLYPWKRVTQWVDREQEREGIKNKEPEAVEGEGVEKRGGGEEDSSQGEDLRLQVLKPAEGFLGIIKICFTFAILFSAPFCLWQMWKFIGAGLYRHERRGVMTYFPLSVGLFAAGALFGYFILLPLGLYFLTKFLLPDTMKVGFSFGNYISFAFVCTLVLGFIFQLPLVMLFFCRVGITTPEFFSRRRKHLILVAFILAAIFTPPDAVTQVLLAIPIMFLFEFGIILSKLSLRKAAQRTD